MLCAAQNITVAAASDLNFALPEIVNKFQADTGKQVKVTFGSSGNFFTGIENGAPYDVFFSADVEYPTKLQAGGLTDPGTLYEYAVGKLVVWVPAASKLDLNRGLQVLSDPSIRRVAIANPKHAPYGRAAVAALTSAKIYDSVAPKLVMGENISQAAQFVQTGNAEAGIVALSLAMGPSMSKSGRFYVVPAELYPPIDQAAVVLRAARDKSTARRFVEFMKSPYARQVLERYGFGAPSFVAPSAR